MTKTKANPETDKLADAKAQRQAQFDSIKEMVEELRKQEEGEDAYGAAHDEAIERIREDALSVQVRSGWYQPGAGLADNGGAEELAARTLAARTLAARTLAARTLAARTLAARTLAARTFAARTLAARTLAARTLAARTFAARTLAARTLAANGSFKAPCARTVTLLCSQTIKTKACALKPVAAIFRCEKPAPIGTRLATARR